MNILVCIPYYKGIHTLCRAGLDELRASKKHNYIVIKAKGSEIALARNLMLAEYKKFDRILTVDSDTAFIESDVDELISMNFRVCALPYERRGMKDFYLAGMWVDGKPGVVESHMHFSTKGIQRMDFVGAGMTMYYSEILDEKFYPWYRHPVVEKEDALFGKMLQAEDMGFCMYLKEQGFDILVNFDHPVKHILEEEATFKFSPQDIKTIVTGLNELKAKDANPILQSITKQVGELTNGRSKKN